MPKVDVRTLSTLPTVSGYITRAAYTRLKDAGVDVNRMLKNAKLTKRQIDEPSARLSARSQINFLQLAATAIGDEYLGIRLAQSFDLRELGLLYYVQASSDVLGDALQRAARYSTIINESVQLEYRAGKNVSIAFKYLGVSRHTDQQQIEFFVTTLLRICRQLSGRRVLPIRIQLVHRRKSFPAEFQRLAGCKIEFGKPVDEITFPKSIEHTPLLGADPYLNLMLIKFCDQVVSSRATKSGAWRSKLENVVAPLLPHGKANLAATAESLGVSRRTLARRLSSEGLTFTRVLEKLRSDLAKQYLKENDLSVSTIAWLLGYREISAFTRAFKRWTGMTPRRMRPSSSAP